MIYEDDSTPELDDDDPVIVNHAQTAQAFTRLLIHGWLDPESMTPELAYRWGKLAGHYGRMALAEREPSESSNVVPFTRYEQTPQYAETMRDAGRGHLV